MHAIPLLHINWNLSNACSFGCRHCYSRDRAGKPELDRDGRLKVAANIVRSGVFDVNFGGGEPLECPDLFETARLLADGNVSVSICTNGWEASAETAQNLLDCGIRTVNVSIDGSTPEVHDLIRGRDGSLEHALVAMRVYTQAGLEVKVSSTITSASLPQVKEIVELAQAHGANAVEFKRLKLQGNAAKQPSPCIPLSDAEEALLFETFPAIAGATPNVSVSLVYTHDGIPGIDAGCPCGKSVLAVMADGSIAPCVYNPTPLGNAVEHSILGIRNNSPELERFRQRGICPGLETELEYGKR